MTIRMRVLPRFPARISGTNGIQVIREANSVDLAVMFDFDALARVPAVDNPDTRFFVVWNEDDDSYAIMSFTDTFAAVIDTAGLMAQSVYDPQEIEDDAFDRANHTGEQAISTVTNLQTSLDTLTNGKLSTTDGVRYDAAQTNSAARQAQARTNISAALKGHIFGLTLSNNGADATNDIDIAAGEAASTETSPVLMVLASTITKRLDAAWAVGSGNGGLDTGAIANGWYYIWLIQRSDTGVVDALFSTSATAPTMPTNYDRKRLIGPVFRSAGALLGFTQNGDEFWLATAITDVNVANLSTTPTNFTLTVPPIAGVKAILQGQSSNAAAWTVSVYATGLASAVATIRAVASGVATMGQGQFRVNGSGQITAVSTAASTTLVLYTVGWVYTRGRDA